MKKKINKFYIFNIFLFLSYSIFGQAQSFFSGTIENDSLGVFLDRYYSSGARMEYYSNDILSPSEYFTKLLLSIGSSNNCFRNRDKCKTEMSSYSLSHFIYTPELFKGIDANRNDRPYAGVANIGNSYSVHLKKLIFHNEFILGNVGPSSSGRDIQEMIHSVMYFNTPRGWNHELKDKQIYNWNTGFSFILNENFMIPLGFGLGNYDTNVNLSFQWRIGQISSKKTFTGHSMHVSSASGFYEGQEDSEYYFFIQPLIKVQSVNASLTGDSKYSNTDWKGISDDRTFHEWERYLMYSLMIPNQKPENYIEDVLVFNTLFNDLRYFNRMEGRAILDYIYKNDTNIYDDKFILAVYNLLRPEDPSFYAYSKYIAVKRISENSGWSEDFKNNVILFLYKNGEFDLQRPHSLKPKNFQGQLQLGFVYRTNEAFLSASWTLASLDFPSDPALPQFHAWGRVQAGIYF